MRHKGNFPTFPYLNRGPHRIAIVSVFTIFLTAYSSFALQIPPAQSIEPKKLMKEATKLTRGGSFVEAENLLRKVVAFDSARSDAKIELAYALTKQRRLGEAYEIVFPIVQKEPKNARAFSVLGAMMLTAGRFQEARILFFNAIKLNRREHLAWAGYGLLDFYENNINESVENLREAVFHAPDEPDYLFALAQVSSRAERYAEAADAYRDFLNISNSSDEDRRARIKGLISFLRYLGNAGSLYRVGGNEQTSVDFELVGNRPIIKLKINGGKEQLKFVLDTGSGISVVSQETAKRLKIKAVTKGGFARGIGGNGKFEIVYGLLRELSIGDVNMRQIPVYIRKFHDDAHAVDGYIGLAMISKFLTTIDYGAKTFSLTRRVDDEKVFRENIGTSLPLRLTSSGFLSGEVQLQGVESPLNFIVDTGASVSVISSDVAKQTNLKKDYLELRGLDDKHYQSQLVAYIDKFSPAKRADIEAYLLDKLPQVLDENQKRNKVKNLLQSIKKQGLVNISGKLWMSK